MSARTATSGIGSTGVPTEQSTSPPGAALATSFSSASWSCGYGGGTNPSAPLFMSSRSRRFAPGRSGHASLRAGIPGARSLGSWLPTIVHDELTEASEIEMRDAGPHPGATVAVHLDEHLTLAVERRHDVA